jgi:hypothetical protein
MHAADDTGNPDLWIDTVRVVGDPWVVAAARSGDARAMRCLAHRVSPHQTTHEAQVLETAHWFAEAARHGDRQATAELDSYLQTEHFAQHLARVPAESTWRRTRVPQECRAGAEQGYASCMLRWAAHLRALGPDHDAEADQWLERAQHGQPDLPMPPGPTIGLSPDPAGVVLTAGVTAAVIPFVQAMVTKAGEDSYDGLRHWLLDVFRRALPPRHKPDPRDQLLVISQPPDKQHAALLQVWTDLPDEAITALSQLLYDMRIAQPAKQDSEKRWYWNNGTRRWELLQLPQTHLGHEDTTGST